MSTEVSRARAWFIASRPQTLPTGAAPVIVGTAVAYYENLFSLWPAVAALVGALLIQIGTNFANDYYDAVKGVDDDDREGFTRVTHAGLLPPERVKQAAFVTFGLAILVGTYLVYVGGLPILIIGLASVISGYAYAGGPYPLGSNGLGDLFVFLFFGVIAVTGTVYVQATEKLLTEPFPMTVSEGTIPMTAILASLPMAAFATNVLVINNIRDLENDKEAGKQTLAVLIGYGWSRIEFIGLIVLAYIIPILLWLGLGTSPVGVSILLPLLTLPFALGITRTILNQTDGTALNPALENLGKVLFIYAILFAVGMVMSNVQLL